MVRKTTTCGKTHIDYYIHGYNPKLLIHSGMHGDEWEVIELVKEVVAQHKDKLPDFVFVPVASPSAVAAATRTNRFGNDLNRVFFAGTKDEEAIANMKIVQGYSFDTFLSFHEDIEFSQFYLYDSHDFERDDSWKLVKHDIRKMGVSMLTGIDDPNDPNLQFYFHDGYCCYSLQGDVPCSTTFEEWSRNEGIVERVIMPEIPSTIKSSIKKRIVESIFKRMILSAPEESTELETTKVDTSQALDLALAV